MKQGVRIDSIFDTAAFAVVMLNFTNLYTFLSGLTGISFRVVSSFFILFMAFYSLMNVGVLVRILTRRPFVWFVLLYAIIPIATIAYAPYRELRYVAYTVNFLMIFLVTSIWIYKCGWKSFSKVILASWFVCIAGVFLSYLAPGIFEQVALLQESASGNRGGVWSSVQVAQESSGRAFGFYMQSNRVCQAVMIHLLILLPVYFHNRSIVRILMLSVSFLAVLLTGSRGGFIMMIGFSGLLFLYELKNGVRVGSQVKSGGAVIPKYGLVGFLGVLAVYTAILLADRSGYADDGQVAVLRILETLFSNDGHLVYDGSVQARSQTQMVYIDRILERPIFGRGHFSDEWGMYAGLVPLSAHNMYLDLAYQYGVPVMLASYGLLFYLAFSREAQRMTEYFRVNFSVVAVVVFCAYGFVSNTIFDLRMFPALMAFWLIMLYFPDVGEQRMAGR
jgi:hypothetical protein